MTRFSIATRDELWIRGRLAESRLSHGEAVDDGDTIIATDARDEALVAACDLAIEELRRCVRDDLRMRLVAEAAPDGVTRTIAATFGALSVVTTPEHLEADIALLLDRGDAGRRFHSLTAGNAPLPLLWKNGSAAVLLHEAIGHAREHEHPELDWPSWLDVDIPLEQRRASFRDVPLPRMKHVAASQNHAPFVLPPCRIEILLLEGGIYEALTETVTLRVAAADLVEGEDVQRLAPFTLTATRQQVARSLLGATGAPLRYPGVICSREGQELVVPSFAPLLLTEAL